MLFSFFFQHPSKCLIKNDSYVNKSIRLSVGLLGCSKLLLNTESLFIHVRVKFSKY